MVEMPVLLIPDTPQIFFPGVKPRSKYQVCTRLPSRGSGCYGPELSKPETEPNTPEAGRRRSEQKIHPKPQRPGVQTSSGPNPANSEPQKPDVV